MKNQAEMNLERTRCEIYTRVMGYHRPVTSFNIGKKAEFYSRTYFVHGNQKFLSKYAGE